MDQDGMAQLEMDPFAMVQQGTGQFVADSARIHALGMNPFGMGLTTKDQMVELVGRLVVMGLMKIMLQTKVTGWKKTVMGMGMGMVRVRVMGRVVVEKNDVHMSEDNCHTLFVSNTFR